MMKTYQNPPKSVQAPAADGTSLRHDGVGSLLVLRNNNENYNGNCVFKSECF